MKKAKLKTYFVYMNNATNRDDDEVFKVKAFSEAHAKLVADVAQQWQGRFSVGWAMPYYPKSKADKEFLKDYRWWASDHTDATCEELE
jgi:hypothetical protein